MRDQGLPKIRTRIAAYHLLRIAKRNNTYFELSELLGFPFQDISKYVKGAVMPSIERSQIILEKLDFERYIKDILNNYLTFDSQGFINNSVIVHDTDLLYLIAYYIYLLYKNDNITKVLTAAADGIPIATIVAELLGVPLAFAKKQAEIGVSNYLRTKVIIKGSGTGYELYIDANMLDSRDNILIVDDILRQGETLEGLISLSKKVRANVYAVFVILKVGSLNVANILPVGVKFNALVRMQ